MQSFVDNIITYLDGKFTAETSITNKPSGHYAYEKGLEPTATTPFYVVQLLDDSTDKEDFESEVSRSVPIQINIYGVKMKINNIIKNSQYVAYYLSDKCKTYMEQYKYAGNNSILEMRRTAYTQPMPYEDGEKAYYSVLRYNIIIKE